MKLSDLKAGRHAVELRNGARYIALEGEGGMFLSGVNSAFDLLEKYDQSMLYKQIPVYDICKVYSIGCLRFGDILEQTCNKNPIWERQKESPNIGIEKRINILELHVSSIIHRLQEEGSK